MLAGPHCIQQHNLQHIEVASAGAAELARQQWVAAVTHAPVWLQPRRLGCSALSLALQVALKAAIFSGS